MADDSNVLLAIANLRSEVVQKLTDQALLFRDRLEDMERRHTLDLRENIIKIWERLERLQSEIYAVRSDSAKSDADHKEKRAVDYRAVAVIAISALMSIGGLVFQYVFHIK